MNLITQSLSLGFLDPFVIIPGSMIVFVAVHSPENWIAREDAHFDKLFVGEEFAAYNNVMNNFLIRILDYF